MKPLHYPAYDKMDCTTKLHLDIDKPTGVEFTITIYQLLLLTSSSALISVNSSIALTSLIFPSIEAVFKFTMPS